MENSNFFGYSPYNTPPDNIENQYNEFNPISQYEQGYKYYKYLTQQLEYKIKCKEYEKICNVNKERRA